MQSKGKVKLFTFQRPEVLENINSNGVHEMTEETFKKHSNYNRLEPVYKRLMKRFRHTNFPVWAYYRRFDDELTVAECFESLSGMHNPNDVLLEIEVPSEQVVLVNYYEWSDYIFYTLDEPDDAIADACWDSLTNIEDADTIQAILPKIAKEMIVGTHSNPIKNKEK